MTVIVPTTQAASPDSPRMNFQGNSMMVIWGPMAKLDTGLWWPASNFQLAAVQALGTFGVNGSVSLEGSNDGVTGFILKDAYGSAATFTSAGGTVFLQSPLYIRPSATDGDGTTALTIRALMRRQANDGQHV